jgi:SAM-dependent methyltransferase
MLRGTAQQGLAVKEQLEAETQDPIVTVERVDCAVCGADDASMYHPRMYALADHFFDLVRCNVCGLVYINPRPSPATYRWLYDTPDYYNRDYNLGVETDSYFSRREELISEYSTILESLETEINTKGDLLELGSAGGFFLEAARRRGWRVSGVEISSVAVQYSKQEFGFDVFEGLLLDSPFSDESFDLIVADNVIEHTLSTRQDIQKLKALLKPGGYLYIVVPTYVNSVFFRMLMRLRKVMPTALLGSELRHILKLDKDDEKLIPYHILEFNRSTVVELMRRAGLEVISVKGSVPLPAHLFRRSDIGFREKTLREVFRLTDCAMKHNVIPGVRQRVIARKPS